MYRFTRIVFANYRRLSSFKNQIDFTPKFPKTEPPTKFILGSGLASSLLAFLEDKKEEETEKQESDLIMTIKRGKFQSAYSDFDIYLYLVYTKLLLCRCFMCTKK